MAEHGWALVEKELASTAAVPLRTRIACWRRGFLGEAAALYDFTGNDRRLYLSDHARFVKTRLINGPYGVLLDDKLLLGRLLRDHARYLPEVLGTLSQGRVVPFATAARARDGAALQRLLRERGALVVKPVAGGGGRGVTVLRDAPAGLSVNGRPTTPEELDRAVAGFEGYMVGEFVRQHPAVAALHPATTNTLRVVTMIDDDGPFIAAAVQRIGCARSSPTDNWTGGGLSAAIDLKSGQLGPAASYPAGRRRLEWHARHPEGGAAIEGTTLPGWPHVSAAILDIAATLPFLPYVGWDIVLTADGFRILEGNHYSDVNLLQIHRPLLADPRVAAFYRRHHVIR